MPIHTYTNWNIRVSDAEEQIEPFRKYFFICEGANTETFYFRKLIDLKKTLNIHPLNDIRLMEKTEEHSNLSYPKQLLEFADTLKDDETLDFDKEHDGMNSKKNSKIGDLAENVAIAIEKEKYINQDIHNVKGVVSSNIASIIEGIIADRL